MSQSQVSKAIRGAVAGAIGGAIGGLTMTLFAAKWNRHVLKENQKPFLVKSSKLAMSASPQEWDSTLAVADKVGQRLLHHGLSQRQRALGATAVHYSAAVSIGAAYGALAEAWPEVTTAGGVAFGAGLWLAGVEFLLPRLGMVHKRDEYTAAMHADSAGEHLVYSVSMELARSAIRKYL